MNGYGLSIYENQQIEFINIATIIESTFAPRIALLRYRPSTSGDSAHPPRGLWDVKRCRTRSKDRHKYSNERRKEHFHATPFHFFIIIVIFDEF